MIENIVDNYHNHKKVIHWIKNNADQLEHENWDVFIKAMCQINPQSYGSIIEKRIIRELGLTRNRSNQGTGDCHDMFGVNHEIKISMVRDINSRINLVQIRDWQSTDYYCFAFFLSHEDVYGACFRLTHEDMVEELEITNATNAHGTKHVADSNMHVERSIRLRPSMTDEHFLRWIDCYTTGFFPRNSGIMSVFNRKTAEEAINAMKRTNLH